MMSQTTNTSSQRNASGKSVNSYQSLVSNTAIPRPISGTSRRASFSVTALAANIEPVDNRLQVLSPSDQTNQFSGPGHKSFRTNDGMPPTSFSMPRAMLPRSDSQIPYKDRSKPDLSGTKELFHIRHYSTSELCDPDYLPRPYRDVSRLSQQQHSQKVTETLHAKKEIQSRALMRQIQPTLPRSQTIAHLACLPNVRDASPSKPARKSDLGQRLYQKNDSQLDVVDALLESRMTKPEIENLDKVRVEAMTNQRRLGSRSTLLSPVTGSWAGPVLEKIPSDNTKSPPASKFSVNDNAGSEKLQVKGGPSLKPLFVNTALANTVRTYDSSPLSSLTPRSENSYFTLSSPELCPDPKHVRKAEGTGYWTGRYVAATDRVRTLDQDLLLKPGKDGRTPNINSSAFEASFDKLDGTRMARVLEDLRQSCKTKSALRSFVEFEDQLKCNTSTRPPPFTRSKSDLFWMKERNIQYEDVERDKVTNLKEHSGNDSNNQSSSFNTQGTFEKISGLMGRKGGLVKSKTTGNLASKCVSQRVSTPGILPTPGLFQPQRLLQTKYISETRARAIEDREARPQVPSQSKFGQSDRPFHSFHTDDVASFEGENGKATTTPKYNQPLSHPQDLQDTPQNVASDSMIAPDLTIRALETRHGVPVPNDSHRGYIPNRNRANLTDTTSTGNIRETILFSKKEDRNRRSSGQKSGDIVKKVVGASIREVRKMSRRVGSMGWGNSTDDLPNNVKESHQA